MIKPIKHRILAWRTIYLRLPRFAQKVAILFAFVLGMVGFILLLPLPELGVPLLLVAISILSFQYVWAERLLLFLLKSVENKKVKYTLTVVGIVFVVIITVLWFAEK